MKQPSFGFGTLMFGDKKISDLKPTSLLSFGESGIEFLSKSRSNLIGALGKEKYAKVSGHFGNLIAWIDYALQFTWVISPDKTKIQYFDNTDESRVVMIADGLLKSNIKKIPLIFSYKGIIVREPIPCKVIGYLSNTEYVIEFEGEIRHVIHPKYLSAMQASSFKLFANEEDENAKVN